MSIKVYMLYVFYNSENPNSENLKISILSILLKYVDSIENMSIRLKISEILKSENPNSEIFKFKSLKLNLKTSNGK